MNNLSKISKGTILILLSGMLLAACSGGAPATPTTDPNMLFTQVAQTVMVSITQTAAAMPTNTLVPTNTPIPTPIQFPTQDMNAITTTPQVVPGYPTPTVQRYGDAAQWYGQSPADGLTYAPYQQFNFHGCMRNIGTTIWNTSYYLKFISGPNLWGGTVTWPAGGAVKPGGVWCWDFNPGTMPASKGPYKTILYFYTDRNQFMQEAYFSYVVTG